MKKMEIEVTQAKGAAKEGNSKVRSTLEDFTDHKQQIDKQIEDIKNLIKMSSSSLTSSSNIASGPPIQSVRYRQ